MEAEAEAEVEVEEGDKDTFVESDVRVLPGMVRPMSATLFLHALMTLARRRAGRVSTNWFNCCCRRLL